jgi:hypothetical protein
MRKFLMEIFSETGDISCMRVMAFMVTCTAIYLALTHGDTTTIGVLLGASIGGKVGQKFAERD